MTTFDVGIAVLAIVLVLSIRSGYRTRGSIIATTQFAVQKWKRRAADKTAEVHRLRRLLRDHGIDGRRTK